MVPERDPFLAPSFEGDRSRLNLGSACMCRRRRPVRCSRIPKENFLPFSTFDLHPTLLRGVRDLGFVRPTPIQADAIPPVSPGVIF